MAALSLFKLSKTTVSLAWKTEFVFSETDSVIGLLENELLSDFFCPGIDYNEFNRDDLDQLESIIRNYGNMILRLRLMP